MVVALGTFTATYNRDNVRENRDTDMNYRPNIEAILVNEEKNGHAPVVHIPRRRNLNGNINGKLVNHNYYNRKQQM